MKKRCSVLFIIGSCIHPAMKKMKNGKIRYAGSVTNRLEETEKTIDSIRHYVPDAGILIVDNGVENFEKKLEGKVDFYQYIGTKKIFNTTSRAKNKGLGEVFMMLYALRYLPSDYDMIMKISGRYCLDEKFVVHEWCNKYYNFLNYDISGNIVEEQVGKYKRGSHSTRLYSFPAEKVRSLWISMICCLPRMILLGESIETALPRYLFGKFRYHEIIGIYGTIAGETAFHE